MEDNELLESRLGNISQGALGFRALGVFFLVIGIVVIVLSGVQLLPVFRTEMSWMEGLKDVLGQVLQGVSYLALSWLSRRASDAFDSVGALIREMREIV